MRSCSTCGERAPLCDDCVHDLETQLVGVARVRGYRWGRAVRAVVRGQPWPAYEASDRIQAIARRKVIDVARDDERLLDRLARAAAAAARTAYEEETPVPGSVAFPRKR